MRFFCDFEQDIGESVQGLFAFRFSWLDHQGFMDNEREVICRWMQVVIHHSLGNIQGMDVWRLRPPAFQDELMHANPVIGQEVGVFQVLQQVIGVENRIL